MSTPITLVFAATTASVHHAGRVVRIAQDDPWYADDPFVVAHPEMFRGVPGRVFGTRAAVRPVEQATARPGELRAGKRG